MRKWGVWMTLICFMAVSTPAQNDTLQVSAAIVLAADVSGSISDDRFKLQREGYANALTDLRVLRSIQATRHRRIAVTYIEWSDNQVVVVPWMIVSNAEEALRVAQQLYNAPRSSNGSTGIGGAINFSLGLIAASPFLADRYIIDVSGDGVNNVGEMPEIARNVAEARGIQINGIVIYGPLSEGLFEHYRDNVITFDGFVMRSEGFEEFAYALVSKLMREMM